MRHISATIIMSLLFIAPAWAQNQRQSLAPITSAKTVAEVEKATEAIIAKVQEQGIDDARSYKAALGVIGNAMTAAGDKIVNELGKTDADLEKGYRYKIQALKALIERDQLDNPRRRSTHEQTLGELIDALEKEGRFPAIVNDERFEQYVTRISRSGLPTKQQFRGIVEELKAWANKKPATYMPSDPLIFAANFSTHMAEDDPEFIHETVKDLVAFVNSGACTVPADEKKEALMRLDGFHRRCIGSELGLYGKTIDNKEFDWNSYRGKYVLVKFTASWCTPCRLEVPGMLRAYAKYKDRGFDIVSVGIQDRTANLRNLVRQERMTWTMLSEELTERAGRPGQGTFYVIEKIPTMLLVDKEGKVLATDMQGDALQKKLVELLGN